MSIRIDDLTVTFKNGVTAVDHVDLEIPHGIFGLLGENGVNQLVQDAIRNQQSRWYDQYSGESPG